MVLLGTIGYNGSTVTLFRTENDSMNVYFLLPAHTIGPSTNNVKIRVLGNSNTNIPIPLYVEGVVIPTIHPFLDAALGVIRNPEVLNSIESLRIELFLAYSDTNDITVNSEVEVLYVNLDSRVNVIGTRIISTNYELGTQEGLSPVHNTPPPGGYLELQLDAKKGLSGALVLSNKKIIGMISINSSIANKNSKEDSESYALTTNKNLSIKMYYVFPWIFQVTSNFFRLTRNNRDKLKDILKFNNLETFREDSIPVVLDLGADYINNNMSNTFNSVIVTNIHRFLSLDLVYSDVDSADSNPVNTLLNTNPNFVLWYHSHPADTVIHLRSYTYTDRVTNNVVAIDLNNKNNNISDLFYRGDNNASVELNFQAQTMNDDGSVTMSNIEMFNFLSSQTVDTCNGRSYARTTSEISRVFFNQKDSFNYLENFGMSGVNNSKLMFSQDLISRRQAIAANLAKGLPTAAIALRNYHNFVMAPQWAMWGGVLPQ
jgi:hypothetical protein